MGLPIEQIQWDEATETHIARHHVRYSEVADVCFGAHRLLHTRDGRFQLLGRTTAGRYLVVVVEETDQPGDFRIVTARDMTPAERRYFSRKR
ncbi:MAG: BrnT family toxin [Chloroflexota bacterium]|nr:MAG: BrnT family toxin [Chloroflexota bacterium]